MKAKVTSISTAQQKEASESNWRSFANALSGSWGWQQTKLAYLNDQNEHEELPITWRVSPLGAVAFFKAPQKNSITLALPYTKPTTATASTKRGSLLYHKGGFITEEGGSPVAINPSDTFVSVSWGKFTKVEIFFDYIAEA